MKVTAFFKGRGLWLTWLGSSVVAIVAGTAILWKGTDKTFFLPGITSNGHYQIEMRCSECHTPFMGVKQDACMNCHKEALDIALDTHPRKKFTNPGNAYLLEKLRADQCVTCHREHVPDQTRAMGVTLPLDYCYFCHDTIGEERESHQGLAFDTCLDCHNFHDNRALYENFLAQYVDEPNLLADATVPSRRPPRTIYGDALQAGEHDGPAPESTDRRILSEWSETIHARQGVNCRDCHQSLDPATNQVVWNDHLTQKACVECHKAEVKGFLAGRHGMRLSQNLSPMTPGMARQPMKRDAVHRELDCTACHSAHRFDLQYAAVDACLGCHSDDHSLAYTSSSHYGLWQAEVSGSGPIGSGVSCATCHMPRMEGVDPEDPAIRVQHNQNDTLRPNSKMARPVCMHCHGLEFTLNALADRSLIPGNYDRPPTIHLQSMEWVRRRLKPDQ